jgi:hypothetical protein
MPALRHGEAPITVEKCKSLYISFQADHANNLTCWMEFCNSVILVYDLAFEIQILNPRSDLSKHCCCNNIPFAAVMISVLGGV